MSRKSLLKLKRDKTITNQKKKKQVVASIKTDLQKKNLKKMKTKKKGFQKKIRKFVDEE